MCGIFALLNNDGIIDNLMPFFMRGKGRGPDNSVLKRVSIQAIFGFHRLAINGLTEESNQPITLYNDNIILICNGEIFNYLELYELMGIPEKDRKTKSDCEVIIHLYERYGIYQTLSMLDGVFSFVLYDSMNINTENMDFHMYVARDPFGVRPLYYSHDPKTKEYLFSSEMKMIPNIENRNIQYFTPGTYCEFILKSHVTSRWELEKSFISYYVPSPTDLYKYYKPFNSLKYALELAVKKRCFTTERNIACLLSGGLDSSIIAALVCRTMKEYRPEAPAIETYSIGLPGSKDLYYAKMVADYIQSNHTEIIVTEDEMFNAIPEVIYAIESYDTTTVRASIGNYLLGKYISKHSTAKVIFNGDGSDELFGGYLYMKGCPNAIEFDRETRRLLKDIHMFDVLRSDKSISSNGLEPRTPFLDKQFVNEYFSLSLIQRYQPDKEEKYILRELFKEDRLLPEEVRTRRKEAFSDGVSGTERSFYQVVQEKIGELPEYKSLDIPAIEKEKLYYKSIFLSCYPNQEGVIPYYWMPKYTKNGETNDPSARTLSIYIQTT